MRKLLFSCALLILAVGVFFFAVPSEVQSEEKMKVALLLSGPANDQGWNATALDGLNAAKDTHGVEASFMENVGVVDGEAAYTDYAAQGYKLIIGHGFQFGDPAARVSKNFPDAYFMATEAHSQSPNMASYVMSCEEGAYLMGLLCASMSKSGKIGVVGGVEQPSIIKEIEAFKIAARKVNPAIEVYALYINSFTDVALGKEAALTLIDKGADVLYHVANQAGTGLIKAAQERGILACGNSYDQNSIAPETVMCSTVYNMPGVILNAVEKVKGGKFEGGIFYLGMKDGIVDISDYHSFNDKIPQTVKDMITEARAQIKDGSFTVLRVETSTK